MFTWQERLDLAQAFVDTHTSVKGISSIGTHKATFRTVTGSESYDYYFLSNATADYNKPTSKLEWLLSPFAWIK